MSGDLWLGLLLGFVIAGALGYIAQAILFHANAIGDVGQPQAVVHHTAQTPLDVLWQGGRSVFGLFNLVSSGGIFAAVAYAVIAYNQDSLAWFLAVECAVFFLSLVAFQVLPFVLIFILSLVQAGSVYLLFSNWDFIFSITSYYY